MSRAGSSSYRLIQSVTGGRPAENKKSTPLRLLIRRHGLPPQDIPLPDEGNEKDSDYDDDDNEKDSDIPLPDEGNEKDLHVQKNKKEQDPPFDPGHLDA